MLNKILIAVIVLLLIAGGYIYFQYRAEYKRNIDLITQLSLPTERIDSNTVRQTGIQFKNIYDFVKGVSNKVLSLAKERNQEIRYITKIEYKFRIDTIKIKADSIIYVQGREYGFKKISEKYYSLNLSWACNPYEAVISELSFRDKITLIGYETESGYGVYATNENPDSRIDSVSYFIQKPKEKIFSFGLGIGTNSSFDEVRPAVKLGYKKHSLLLQTDLKQITKRKPVFNDFYFTYIYEF